MCPEMSPVPPSSAQFVSTVVVHGAVCTVLMCTMRSCAVPGDSGDGVLFRLVCPVGRCVLARNWTSYQRLRPRLVQLSRPVGGLNCCIEFTCSTTECVNSLVLVGDIHGWQYADLISAVAIANF